MDPVRWRNLYNLMTYYYNENSSDDCYSSRFLSTFTDDKNISYNCLEQYVCAHKALIHNDQDTYKKIMITDDSEEQIKLSKQIKYYDENKWLRFGRTIILKGNKYKFTQNKDLKERLLRLKGKEIVCVNNNDDVWGTKITQEGNNFLGMSLETLINNFN